MRTAIMIMTIFTVIMFTLLGYIVAGTIIAETRCILPYKELQESIRLRCNVRILSNIPSREQMRKDVEQMFDNPIYFYYECEFGGDGFCTGYAFIPFGIVIIDTPMLTEQLYAWTLAHELTHITSYTTCERYCNFNTFKVLYESGKPYYVEVAKLLANSLTDTSDTGEYAFGGYVEEYLENLHATF